MPPAPTRGIPALFHRPLGIALVTAGLIAGTGIAVGGAGLLAMKAGTAAQAADACARLTEDATVRLGDQLGVADPVLDALRTHAAQPVPSPEEDARILVALARGRGGLSQAYIGGGDGSFRVVWRDDDLTWRYQRLAAPGAGPRAAIGLLLANDRPPTAEAVPPEQQGYDPRGRPWFLAAVGARARAWSPPYLFARSRQPGVTCSEPVAGGMVVGVDFDFTSLGRVLARLDGEDAGTVVFTAAREILAASHPPAGEFTKVPHADDLEAGPAREFFATLGRLPEPGQAAGKLTFQGARGQVVAAVSAYAVPDGPVWYVGRAMLRDQLAAAGDRARLWAMVAGALALLPGLGAAFLYARVLARARAAAAQATFRAEAAEEKARKLGQYQVVRKLGQGGMGEVYLARHAMMRRPSVVKVMRKGMGQEDVQRFEREVQLSCQLSHPNTVTIFDYGRSADGAFYYAMEYLEGLDLDSLVERHGAQPAARVIHLLAQACGSLAEAHAMNLVHRDIKPANIMVCQRGGEADVVKVLDFGLVKSLERDRPGITSADVITGTPEFMAPEVISQSPDADGRLDLYALACVGFFLLTGKLVFPRQSTMEVLLAHRDEPPPRPSVLRPEVPADLERVLLKALSKDPRDRQEDMNAFRAELLSCADAHRWSDADARTWWIEHPLPAAAVASSAQQSTLMFDSIERAPTDSSPR